MAAGEPYLPRPGKTPSAGIPTRFRRPTSAAIALCQSRSMRPNGQRRRASPFLAASGEGRRTASETTPFRTPTRIRDASARGLDVEEQRRPFIRTIGASATRAGCGVRDLRKPTLVRMNAIKGRKTQDGTIRLAADPWHVGLTDSIPGARPTGQYGPGITVPLRPAGTPHHIHSSYGLFSMSETASHEAVKVRSAVRRVCPRTNLDGAVEPLERLMRGWRAKAAPVPLARRVAGTGPGGCHPAGCRAR